VYTGHDENTYFVGSRLVSAIKDLWPDWKLHQWTSPFYERPPRIGAVRARLHLLGTEEGGRRTPIATGYRAACWIDPSDPVAGGHDGVVTIEGDQRIAPGEEMVVHIRFLPPDLVGDKPRPGVTFDIREGARVVGRATVLSTA
jgi:translation elongation factor EF-Tu-like GTPase